ncbi:MAG: long-chain fatty acid--CoA ligase, partial [bacterium]
NVSPAVLENRMVEDDLISQAMVYGDGKRYLTALVVPDYERIAGMAAELGLDDLKQDELDPHRLAKEPRLNTLFMGRIEARLGDLASYERIKKVFLLDRELTEADGELTPTMKVKRKVVSEKFKRELDALYEE